MASTTRTPFEGYSIQDGYPLTIYKPNGDRLGQAFSLPGAKRMVRKDAGTNVCQCGHIPGDHSDMPNGSCLHGLGTSGRVRCDCKNNRSRAMASAKERRLRIVASERRGY